MQTSKQQFLYLVAQTRSLSTVQKKWLQRNFLTIRAEEVTDITATLHKEQIILSQANTIETVEHGQKRKQLNMKYQATMKHFYGDVRPSLFRSAERRAHKQEKEQIQHWFDDIK